YVDDLLGRARVAFGIGGSMSIRTFLQQLSFDAGIGARSLGRSPGFTITAILSLGLAIGAGVAGFGVLDAVRFRALPFRNAERLMLISEVPAAGGPRGRSRNN